MPVNVTINTATGNDPFDVYICDSPITTCVYISTITNSQIPYTFTVPSILSTLTTYELKLVDDNDCIVTQTLYL
jgi:hypothetical protein